MWSQTVIRQRRGRYSNGDWAGSLRAISRSPRGLITGRQQLEMQQVTIGKLYDAAVEGCWQAPGTAPEGSGAKM